MSENETAKVGQFEPTKVRVVITTPEPQKYRAIYANDLQNILIARDDKLKDVKLFSNTSNILVAETTSRKEYRNTVDTINLEFSEPIVHSLKRNDNVLNLSLYNVSVESLAALSQKLKNGNLKNTLTDRLGPIGLQILIPVDSSTTIDCMENLNATKLVLTIKTPVVIQKINKNLSKRTIVVDPGHGGSDPGAMRNDVQEKIITLQIAEKVVKMLEAQGATVYMTRSDDTFVSLSDRVTYSNVKKPDLFVSIHINASERPEIHGIETHYWKDDSIEYAKCVHKSLISKIEAKNRGLFKSKFYVIRHTTDPAILLELGFISNEEERNLMQTEERQTKMAEAITEGIINYLNNTGIK